MSDILGKTVLRDFEGKEYGENKERYYTEVTYDYLDEDTMSKLKKITEDNETERKKSLNKLYKRKSIVQSIIASIFFIIITTGLMYLSMHLLFSTQLYRNIGYIINGVVNIIFILCAYRVYQIFYQYNIAVDKEYIDEAFDDDTKEGCINGGAENLYIYSDAMKLVIALNMPVVIKRKNHKNVKVKRLYQLFNLEESTSSKLFFNRYIIDKSLSKKEQDNIEIYEPLSPWQYKQLRKHSNFSENDIKMLDNEASKIPQLSGKQIYELINISYQRYCKKLNDESIGIAKADANTDELYSQLNEYQENLKKEYENLSDSVNSLID